MTDPSDSTWGDFRKYGLPSESDVEGIVTGSSPSSGAFKVTEAEVVERIMDAKNETAGSRAKEVENWLRGIVARTCETKSGYLDLKGDQ
jgi:3-hydroxyisobutyryl-CoA hydrolase